MAMGLSFLNENERPKDLSELSEEEIQEYIQKGLNSAAQKVAAMFNSFHLDGEKIDLITSLREVNQMLTEQNRMLELAIHNFFKDAETIRDEAVKEFAKMLIEKSENGVIQVSDVPKYVQEMLGAVR